MSILLDDKTLAAVHNLASAPGTESSIVLYTSRKSLGHKALRSGSGTLVVKRRDDVFPGSVRYDSHIYNGSTAGSALCGVQEVCVIFIINFSFVTILSRM